MKIEDALGLGSLGLRAGNPQHQQQNGKER
jgi:hypothetical protein